MRGTQGRGGHKVQVLWKVCGVLVRLGSGRPPQGQGAQGQFILWPITNPNQIKCAIIIVSLWMVL